jgi:hypothetical protein
MADDPEPTDGASASDVDSPQYRPLRGGEGRPPVESAEDSSAGATLELSPVDTGEQVVSRSSRHGRLAAKHGGSLVVGSPVGGGTSSPVRLDEVVGPEPAAQASAYVPGASEFRDAEIELGNPGAVAWCTMEGWGDFQRDNRRARDLLTQGAMGGDATAQCRLGRA